MNQYDARDELQSLLEHPDPREAATIARSILTRMEQPRPGQTLDQVLDTYSILIRRSEDAE